MTGVALRRAAAFAALVLSTAACSNDPTSAGGAGDVTFNTWGEEYIEEEIPSGDEGGFSDGWTLVYAKFLVVLSDIEIADSRGEVGASFGESVVFDHTGVGVKPIAKFDSLAAKHWEEVSYEIKPAGAGTTKHESVSDDDLEYMVDNGFSLHLVGDASRGEVTKHFDWSFDLATRYFECKSERDGITESGVVVTNGGSAEVQLTIHGDHPFYDRLQSAEGIETHLRFDAIAAADDDEETGNRDGEVTMAELEAAEFDPTVYDLSGFPGIRSMADFVRALARTVGHYRGEGECELDEL